MKRHKEQLFNGLELSPLRALGGFLCVDFCIGCCGCRFCLNRRHPLLHHVLERKIILPVPLSGDDMLALLEELPSFARARVPIRCGHISDWRYQRQPVIDLAQGLPEGYPVFAMTRFSLDPEQITAARSSSNMLVHLTVTPRIPRHPTADAIAAIRSSLDLPRRSVYYMVRPLVHGNQPQSLALLASLPPGSFVGFGSIHTNQIPDLQGVEEITQRELHQLRKEAEALGLHVVDYFGCMLRERLELPFFKYHEAIRRPGSYCHKCNNQQLCHAASRSFQLQRLEEELERLEIRPTSIRREGVVTEIETPMPATRAEEAFLSELLVQDVRLSSVRRRPSPGIYALDPSVLQRWERCGFFPVGRLRALSQGLVLALHDRGLAAADD